MTREEEGKQSEDTGGGGIRRGSLRPVGQMGRRLPAPTVDVFGQREMDGRLRICATVCV